MKSGIKPLVTLLLCGIFSGAVGTASNELEPIYPALHAAGNSNTTTTFSIACALAGSAIVVRGRNGP